MPFLTVYTNATKINQKNFVEEISDLVAGELHKPVSYVVVNLQVSQAMAFGGETANRGALLEMKSIGFGDKNALAEALTKYVTDVTDVERRFVNIQFVDMKAADVALGGRTFG